VSGGAIIAIVVVLVILAVAAALASRMAISRSTSNTHHDKRRRRVDGLGIKPLSPEQRTVYSTRWVAAQEAFISNPPEAVRTAGALVTAVAAERGYEVADSGQLLDDLSVYYGNQLDGYRSALAVTKRAEGEAVTEVLRHAMLGCRAMFCALAEISDSDEAVVALARHEKAQTVRHERTDSHGIALR
jgi:hypothetical protein